jgi:hypothetical protein
MERLLKRDDVAVTNESSFLHDFLEKYFAGRADLTAKERSRLFEFVDVPHLSRSDVESLTEKDFADPKRLVFGLLDRDRLNSREEPKFKM